MHFAHVILIQQRRHVQPPLGLVAFERFLWLWYYNWEREIGSKLRLIDYALGPIFLILYSGGHFRLAVIKAYSFWYIVWAVVAKFA